MRGRMIKMVAADSKSCIRAAVALSLRSIVVLVLASGPTLLTTPRANAAAGRWTTHGPWGNVKTIAIAASDPSILYAGTFAGGVFKTTTSGRWWYSADRGIAPNTD